MSTNNISAKKGSKKFNLIFFIDSEKTYHFKFNLIFVKITIVFFILLILISAISIVFGVTFFKKNQIQENYIVSFKKSLLQDYFELNVLKEEKKRENEFVLNAPKKEENKEVKESKEIKENKENKKQIEEVKIIENSGIKIENPRILPDTTKTKVVFSLSNMSSSKSSITGRICAVIIGNNAKGETVIYKIPEQIKLSSQNIPYSCEKGEQVKFSRLRPTEFVINLGKNDFTVKTVNVYFSYINSKGIVVNSF